MACFPFAWTIFTVEIRLLFEKWCALFRVISHFALPVQRWLKQHIEESETDLGSNKENCREGEQVAPPCESPHHSGIEIRE